MIDPQILFQQQPFKIETPLEAQTQVRNLSNLGNQGQLQQNAIVAGGQENQLRQNDIDDANLFRKAYAQAAGDKNKVGPLAAQLGVSPKGLMAWDQTLLAQKTAYSKLNESDLKNIETKNSLIGGAIADVVPEKDPVKQAAAWTGAMNKLVAEGTIPAQEAAPYPGSPEAVQHYVNLHKTSDQLIKETTADAAKVRAGATAQTSNREQLAADVQQISTKLGTAKDQASYAQVYDATPAGVIRAGGFPSPEQWTPQTPAAVLNLGRKPNDIATGEQTATRDQNTQDYRKQELAQNVQRIGIALQHLGIDRQRLGNEMAGNDPLGSLDAGGKLVATQLAHGDFNPGQLGRFKDKEKIVAAAIQLSAQEGRNWSPTIFDVKKSFTDPDKVGSKNLATIARIAGHIGRFEKNSAALGTSLAYGMGATITGNQKVTAEDAHAIASELEKLTSGGVGSQEQTKDWQNNLTSPSADVRQRAADEIGELVGSQYEAMNQQYKGAVGGDLPLSKFVSPVGRDCLKRKGINVTGAVQGAPGVPTVGSTFNGEQVLKVTRIQ